MKLQHEIRHATAGLKRAPVFVFTLVFTLALTLGALLAAFNLNQLILFKALPYANADQLYILEQNFFKDGKDNISSQLVGPQLNMYNKSRESVDSAVVLRSRGLITSISSEPRIRMLYSTYEFFNLLSVRFELGGGFSPSDGPMEARAEAVLTYDSWQKYFGGRSDIIGQSLRFNDDQFTIVGVTQQGFNHPDSFADTPAELYLPVAYSWLEEGDNSTGTDGLKSMVRLAPEQNINQVRSGLTAIFSDYMKSTSSDSQYTRTEFKASLTSLSESVKGDSAQITLIILAGAFVLLLIAFANVINLYLSHISKKQQLLAICACLGAKPKALFKRLFVESLLLTSIAAVFALVIAAWLLVLTREMASETLPRLNELGIDFGTVVFSVLLAIILAALLAFCGRFAVRYDALKEQLTASGKGTSAQVSSKVRHALIASQVSLTGLLILVTSMVLQTSMETVNKPLGIDIANVISFELDAEKNYTSDQERLTLTRQIKQHFSQLPQVAGVSNNSTSPIREGRFGMSLYDRNKQSLGGFLLNRVDQDYLDLIELPILYGRNFNQEEISERKLVTLVSETTAKQVFNKVNVVGEYVYSWSGKPIEIVGVVSDYFSVINGDDPYFYLPLSPSRLNTLIKIKPNMTMSKQQVLEQLRTIDPSLRIQEYLELEQAAQDMTYQYRLSAWLAGGLSLFALILACAGIYGVISYSTQMRRYELGVRMALGARRKRIITMVLKDALVPLLIGLGGSLLLSAMIYGVANSQIAHLGQPDIIQVVVSLVLLMIFSMLACFIPVNSIIKQDPVKALRNE